MNVSKSSFGQWFEKKDSIVGVIKVGYVADKNSILVLKVFTKKRKDFKGAVGFII